MASMKLCMGWTVAGRQRCGAVVVWPGLVLHTILLIDTFVATRLWLACPEAWGVATRRL